MVTRCTSWAYVAAVLLLTGVSTTTAKYSGGTGEPNDPYRIATAADLIALGETPGDYDKNFLLTADIDLDPNLPGRKVFGKAVIAPDVNETTEWWLFDGTPFDGAFDGSGHTISHLTITGNSYLGLFGQLALGGEVKNMGVVDVNIVGLGSYVGGLVGFNYGTVSQCHSTGAVSGTNGVGGLAGVNGGVVTRCYSTGRVSGKSYVGGLVGGNGGTVTDCYSTGAVSGDGSYVGGLVGSNDDGTVTDSCSTGAVIGTSDVGGLVGASDGTVSNSYSTGSVSGTDGVGGLVGSNLVVENCRGTVSRSYSTGPVKGTGRNVGGLVGYNGSDVIQCYGTGAVSGTGRDVGGLVGQNGGDVIQCYSTGAISGSSSVGGLVGSVHDGVVIACLWNTQTSGQSTSAGGTGKATDQMQDIRTYLEAGWDFVAEAQNGLHEVWEMPEAGGYPILAIHNGYTPPQLQGLGGPRDPYLIHDARELGAVSYYGPTAHYRLVASIDLSGVRWATPVIPVFGGTFDGNNLTISHLTIKGGSYLGLFGRLDSGTEVRDLGVADVNITGSGDYVGGLVGQNSDGALIRCCSTGMVSGASYVGGLVGENGGTVNLCASAGAVTGSGELVGGLVGSNDVGDVSHCYSTSSVVGREWVGGLVGGNQTHSGSRSIVAGFISQSYSAGSVRGNSYVGGFVGGNGWGAHWVRDCFWDIEASDQTTSAGGTGKTTAEMWTATTFLGAGWDFVGETANGTEDIWKIAEGLDYPRLRWEAYDGWVTVVLGQVFTVTLESNPSTGYRWEWVDHQDSILEQIGEAQFKPRETGDPPLVGAGGWESFDFKAVNPGQMTLKLVYRRPWEEGVEPLKTFSLQVAVP